MTPQIAMTILLTSLTTTGIILKVIRGNTMPEKIGGSLGIAVRYGMILAILHWSGFYN